MSTPLTRPLHRAAAHLSALTASLSAMRVPATVERSTYREHVTRGVGPVTISGNSFHFHTPSGDGRLMADQSAQALAPAINRHLGRTLGEHAAEQGNNRMRG